MSEKRRVLHLRSSGGLLGAENVVLEIAKFSTQYGWESIVGAINNVNDPYPEILKVADSYHIKNVLFECHTKIDLKCIEEIKKYIEKWNIDIVHTHGYKENLYSFLIKNGIPKVATNHLWKISTLKAKFYCFVDILLIRFFDRVIGVSDEIVKEMGRVGIKNTFKISNGVDFCRFNIQFKNALFAEKYNFREKDFILGMVSSLTYEKNHQAALHALSAIDSQSLKLLIVGGGHLEESLKKQVEQMNLSNRVVFAGKMSNVIDALSVVDVFLLPSLNEGLPMALLEAMASGKAVIATNVGEIANVVENYVNGLLVEKNNVDELVFAIQFLMNNRQKISEYGSAARLTVEKHFSSKLMAQKYCKVYDSFFS